MNPSPASPDHGGDLLALYDAALPEVHGYLMHRVRSRPLAEDLAAETFMGAVDAINRGVVQTVTTAWLIGIARHKLVDHWRRQSREERRLTAIAGELRDEEADPWEVVLDRNLAEAVLARLSTPYRMALTLRYLDGLPVAEVADHMDRSLGSAEKLISRAKQSFRDHYEEVQS